MKSDLPKALCSLNGKPLLGHVAQTARSLDPEKIIVIVGHKRKLVTEQFADTGLVFVVQEPQLGTGHAVAQAEDALADHDGAVMVLSADVPLIREATLQNMLNAHTTAGAAVTILTCKLDDPGAYGRIIRRNGRVVANVEAKDASDEQLAINEINSGIYIFDSRFLFSALKQVNNNNAQGEYYLTDLIAMAVEDGHAAEGIVVDDPYEIMGVNTVEQLEEMEKNAPKRDH